MIYHSVTEIFDAIDKTRGRLYERVGTLSQEQEQFRPATDEWSVREIVEHLAILEESLSKLLRVMLSKVEAAARQDGASAEPTQAMEPFTLDHYIERSLKEKYQAPESVRPSGSLPLSMLLERLRESRALLRSLQPRLEATDLSLSLYPHPVFGPLNAYQWLALIGMHEERHLRQIESHISALPARA
ncbi:MAG: hypothetical protein QOD00_1969 [Blastocatellia bacterium]|jgi:hypothetical protein|nr:hypothetical protein [Blastocatellia bacterium]